MRIFIAIHYLEIGGVETSLINLLLALDPNRVEVDLLVYDPRGEMMELIPDWVHQIKAPKTYHYIERPLKETLLVGEWKMVWARLRAKWAMSTNISISRSLKMVVAIFGIHWQICHSDSTLP